MIGLSATLGGFWMLVFYPAVLTPDSINQWSQALSNQYHTWYPPITAMLMHITQFFTKSPSLFCFIQGTLFWFSILYLLRQVTRRDRFFLGNVCFIVGLPTLWLYSVALVNNVWASTFSLLASTLLIRAIDAKSNSLFFTSVALLSVAICFRHEAVFLSIVPMSLGLFYLWIKSKIYKKIIVIILISLIVIAPAKLLEKLPNVGYRTPTSLVFIGQYVGTIFHGKQQISENEIDVEKNSIDRQFGSGTFDKLLEKYDCTSPNYIFLPPEDSIISASLIQDKTFWVINKTLSIAFRHPLAFIKHKACNVSYLFQIPQISYIYDVRTDQSVYIESDLNKVGIKTDYRLPHVKIWVDNILIVTHQNSIYSLMYRHYVFILFSLIFLFLGLCLKNNEFLIPSLVSCVYLIALLIPDSSTAWRYLLPNYVLSWVCLLGAISNLLAWLFPLLPSKHKVNLS
jgi:hypothetical protein